MVRPDMLRALRASRQLVESDHLQRSWMPRRPSSLCHRPSARASAGRFSSPCALCRLRRPCWHQAHISIHVSRAGGAAPVLCACALGFDQRPHAGGDACWSAHHLLPPCPARMPTGRAMSQRTGLRLAVGLGSAATAWPASAAARSSVGARCAGADSLQQEASTLTRHAITGDGACMFRAVAQGAAVAESGGCHGWMPRLSPRMGAGTPPCAGPSLPRTRLSPLQADSCHVRTRRRLRRSCGPTLCRGCETAKGEVPRAALQSWHGKPRLRAWAAPRSPKTPWWPAGTGSFAGTPPPQAKPRAPTTTQDDGALSDRHHGRAGRL